MKFGTAHLQNNMEGKITIVVYKLLKNCDIKKANIGLFKCSNREVIVLGYVESAIIFVVTIDFVSSHMKKKKEVSKNSQLSDWFLVIGLLLIGLTAFIVRLFIDIRIIDTNIWMYLLHLIVLAQWVLIIVPFGKWTHFLYRSFAMYMEKQKEA